MTLTREVRFDPSYDYRDDGESGRGAHGMEMWLLLKGPKGVVSFSLMTGWMVAPIRNPAWTIFNRDVDPMRDDRPGIDVLTWDCSPTVRGTAVHRPDPNGEKCDFMDGPCNSEVVLSSWGDEEVLRALVGRGDAVWDELEKLYKKHLDTLPVSAVGDPPHPANPVGTGDDLPESEVEDGL